MSCAEAAGVPMQHLRVEFRAMRVLLKVLGIGAALAVVAVAGAIVYVTTIDPATLIAPAQAKVRQATGRELRVGAARIALSLHPRIVLSDVALSNAPWASTPDLVKAQRVELSLALVPLFARRFELGEIRVVAPQLALETDASGRRNWEMRPADAGALAAMPDTGGAHLAAAVAVGDLRIDAGLITYRDAAGVAPTTIAIDALVLRDGGAGSDLRVDFRGKLRSTPVTLSGVIGPLHALAAQRWPYPIDVHGEVDGQPFAVATKVRAQDHRYTLDDLHLTLAGSAVKGRFAVDTGGVRPKLAFDLDASTLALRAVPVPVAPSAAAAPAPGPSDGARFIPDTPIDFAALRRVDAEGRIAIGKLVAADGRAYDHLRLPMTLRDGRFEMRDFTLGALGGTISGDVTVDASRPESAVLALDVDGKALTLGSLLAAAGHPREVQGGRSDLTVQLTMRGTSPRAWLASANGNVRFVSGAATIVNPKVADPVGAWEQLGNVLNPFRTRDATTELVCAVVNLPVRNGVARSDRALALETTKVGVAASGVLDFRDETLDLVFAPQVRQGISLDFAGLSDIVRLSGPFASPRVSVDVAASAKVIASVGAAIGTGGISAAAQALVGWADGRGPGPCQIAQGAAAAPAAARSAPESKVVAPAVEALGKAIGKLFGK